MVKYILIAVFSGILSAFAQVLLKKSSEGTYESRISEYLNPYVIVGYGITFLCMILMILAYKGLPYKYGAVLESLVYLYTMILSGIFLREKISLRKIVGNLFIVCGVVAFSL